MNEGVEAHQAFAPVRHEVRLMTHQLEELCQKVPEERLIINHEHLHWLVAPMRVTVVIGSPLPPKPKLLTRTPPKILRGAARASRRRSNSLGSCAAQ